jgi:hypothetical protein
MAHNSVPWLAISNETTTQKPGVSRGSKYPASPLKCNVSQGGHTHKTVQVKTGYKLLWREKNFTGQTMFFFRASARKTKKQNLSHGTRAIRWASAAKALSYLDDSVEDLSRSLRRPGRSAGRSRGAPVCVMIITTILNEIGNAPWCSACLISVATKGDSTIYFALCTCIP